MIRPNLRGYAGRRVLVAGGAGFIGRHLVRGLAEISARVTVLDPAAAPGEAPGPGRARVRALCGRVQDPAALAPAIRGAEVVFHLAAVRGHLAGMKAPRRDHRENLLGILAVLRGVERFAPGARVVFPSSRQIYGTAQELPVSESHPIAPVDVSGVHQEAAEHLGRHWARDRGIRFSVLRLTNTYGPGQRLAGPGAGFAGAFLGAALAGRPIMILGDPGLVRDLNYVEDVAEALLLAGAESAPSGTWNLGAPPTTLRQFAELVFEALGAPPRVRRAPLPAARAAISPGPIFCDHRRIERDLGWRPRTSLEAGIAATVRSFLRDSSS